MGVDLGDVVPKEMRRLTDFQGKVVAVDAYNTLYQFLSIIRQPDGTPLMDAQGRVTSHLAGLLYRTANLAEAGVKPVFVFDGPPSELKRATLEERRARKEKAQKEYEEAKAAGDLPRAFSKAQQTARLTKEMAGQAKTLIGALGFAWIDAPGEGEAQAAVMAERGLVWAAASQDYDSLLFGAPRLLRNVTVTGRRKLPGKSVWVEVQPEETSLERTLRDLDVNREQLVAVGMLCGTDFNEGIKGVGPKRGVKLLRDHGTLDNVLRHLKTDIPHKDEIQDFFLHPPANPDVEFSFGQVNEEAVLDLLVQDHGFSKDRVQGTFQRFQKLQEQQKQKSLDAFF